MCFWFSMVYQSSYFGYDNNAGFAIFYSPTPSWGQIGHSFEMTKKAERASESVHHGWALVELYRFSNSRKYRIGLSTVIKRYIVLLKHFFLNMPCILETKHFKSLIKLYSASIEWDLLWVAVPHANLENINDWLFRYSDFTSFFLNTTNSWVKLYLGKC